MTRLPDWETRLAAYLASVRERPHAYGQHDCCIHAGNAVVALTGEDRVSDFVGAYSNAFGAARMLKRLGHDCIEELLDAHLPEVAIALARRGDLVLTAEPDGDDAIGVVIGGEAMVIGQHGEVEGLIRSPRSQWRKAWAI